MANNIDKHIRFETKEQSNSRRITEAINRSPGERFQFFLSLLEEISLFSIQNHDSKKQNFILHKGND
jgi:hypothetical protein